MICPKRFEKKRDCECALPNNLVPEPARPDKAVFASTVWVAALATELRAESERMHVAGMQCTGEYHFAASVVLASLAKAIERTMESAASEKAQLRAETGAGKEHAK